MKTAISIPDVEFEAAEKLASSLGVSRSELYRTAIADFMARHAQHHVTKKLNEIYGSDPRLGAIDQDLQQMQAHSIPNEKW